MEATNLKKTAAALSVLSNTALVLAKLAIGLFTGSVSVLSEAIHSGIDLLAAIVAFFAVRVSDQPADRQHAFGHGKIENLSGAFEALLIFVAAIWIIYESVKKFMHPAPVESLGLAVWVMLASSLVNIFVSRYLFKVARATDSIALEADAWHLRTDVYTSAGVCAALLLVWLLRIIAPSLNLLWIDPLAAIAVALLIMHAAYDLSKQALADLIDTALPDHEENWVARQIKSFHPRILGFHNFRSRKSGARRFVEFHIVVDPDMTVAEAHDLNDQLVEVIKQRFANSKIMVHIEPCFETCSDACDPKCRNHCYLNNPPLI